ncbi:MAG: DUF4382 domain-containing protein [Bacteroidota bacterium]|nr:DUF4382 domain-containing protein [Bacteroidota bacterium]
MYRKLFFVLIGSALAFTSCKDDNPVSNPNDPAQVRVMMTDAPGDYDSVFIDVQEIHLNGPNGWQKQAVAYPGIYNLLDLSNGIDTLLINTTMPAGRLQEIRLVLGPNNSVVVDGMTYPLTTPSAQQSGLKLKVMEDLAAGVTYEFTLDFDAQRSIVETGNGSYILKPVIHVITAGTTGAIDGIADPANAAKYAYAVSGTDTVGTTPDTTGYFLIGGLAAGSWDVTLEADSGYTDQTINAVNVVNGQVTHLDTINF